MCQYVAHFACVILSWNVVLKLKLDDATKRSHQSYYSSHQIAFICFVFCDTNRKHAVILFMAMVLCVDQYVWL